MFSRYVMSQVKHNSFFLAGLAIGLWMALIVVPLDEPEAECAVVTTLPTSDDYEPVREVRPAAAPSQAASRAVQRPRYYTTELGMRESLLASVLTTEEMLPGRGKAINETANALHPALRFFITASALRTAQGRANVVGFTDTREMLKPFHALKYLADNYLEEYNFFFLVSDMSYVNALRLKELVSRLSISQDIYMGTPAEDDSHYCSLESGILLSNSVLRAVYSSLDWCVRNSYSAHHHENLGRCILHAAHTPCTSSLQGETYNSVKLQDNGLVGGLKPELAGSVTAFPLIKPEHYYQMHSYVSRVHLQQGLELRQELSQSLNRLSRHHPRGYRNMTWPAGLRHDPGLAPPAPDSRFDLPRWTLFNSSHALMLDDLHAATPLPDVHMKAITLALDAARAYLTNADTVEAGDLGHEKEPPQLVEGAWRWEAATALRYRLLLRTSRADGTKWIRQIEVARPLGAARLVPVPYVTESARVTIVVPLQEVEAPILHKFRTAAPHNAELVGVLLKEGGVGSLPGIGNVRLLSADCPPLAHLPPNERVAQQMAAALEAALPLVPKTALILTALPDMDFTDDFLNRVRMNTIPGESWFCPQPFARFAQYAHPRFVDEKGNKPQQNTGRFEDVAAPILAVYRKDMDDALRSQNTTLLKLGPTLNGLARILARSGLREIRAPEPALLLPPPPPPCSAAACRERLPVEQLRLGARHSLAKLLLETQQPHKES